MSYNNKPYQSRIKRENKSFQIPNLGLVITPSPLKSEVNLTHISSIPDLNISRFSELYQKNRSNPFSNLFKSNKIKTLDNYVIINTKDNLVETIQKVQQENPGKKILIIDKSQSLISIKLEEQKKTILPIYDLRDSSSFESFNSVLQSLYKRQYIEHPDVYTTIINDRPKTDDTKLIEIAKTIMKEVSSSGDEAVKKYTEEFDKVKLDKLAVSENEILEAEKQVEQKLKNAILLAKENIEKFHVAQRHDFPKIETSEGVICWQKAVAIEKVGLYIPSGTAPLFSTVLMLAIPAQIAGCKEIVLCSPPNHEGKIHPAVLYAAQICGVTKIYKIGGIQAISAMAYGTESIPKVYKIFGPGNQYVTTAKQLVSLHDVAIDMPAGPSEVEVLADDTADPVFVAADLLSQAEHGVDSQAILITTSEQLAQKVEEQVALQVKELPRADLAKKALEQSKIIIVKDMNEAIEMTNEYAPEHLIISTENYRDIAEKVTNAGSIFLGHLTPESAGDYASGTNHTLPTNGYAKMYSGVNLDSFVKKITFQELTEEGLQNIGEAIEIMAENEGLSAHKNAISLRMKKK